MQTPSSLNYITTIGVDFRFRSLQVEDYSIKLYLHPLEITAVNNSLKLQIWDTAGQERYRTITNAYYRGADGIVVVFDLTNKESFNSVFNWMEEVKKCAPEDTVIVVFANKCDLVDERQVSEQDIKNFEEKTGIHVVETSAKNSDNVDKGFVFLTTKLIEKNKDKDGDSFENDGSDQFYNPGFGVKHLGELRTQAASLKESLGCCAT